MANTTPTSAPSATRTTSSTSTRTGRAAAADAAAAHALRVAQTFLDRFGDRFTRSVADELAQEAAFEAWSRRTTLRRTECWEAFVRTVSRRRRFRELARYLRVPRQSLDVDRELREQLIAEEPVPVCIRVAGRRVPVPWCAGELDGVLRRLGSLNACIVRSFYEGFSCGELAQRYGLPETCIKVRLHRSRERIRREFERRVRQADAEVWGP